MAKSAVQKQDNQNGQNKATGLEILCADISSSLQTSFGPQFPPPQPSCAKSQVLSFQNFQLEVLDKLVLLGSGVCHPMGPFPTLMDKSTRLTVVLFPRSTLEASCCETLLPRCLSPCAALRNNCCSSACAEIALAAVSSCRM